MKNPIRKHMHKANCCSKIEPSRRQKLKDIASYREELESVSNAEIGAEKAILSEDSDDE